MVEKLWLQTAAPLSEEQKKELEEAFQDFCALHVPRYIDIWFENGFKN